VTDTKDDCLLLGDTYIQMEQYESALALYNRYLAEIQAAGGQDHAWAAEVQGWINDMDVR
jgi:hypothetical protein